MPRYYFHVRRGQVTILDREGIELIDSKEATIEATRLVLQIEARGTLTDRGTAGAIVVDDEEGALLEMPFGGARQISFRAQHSKGEPPPA